MMSHMLNERLNDVNAPLRELRRIQFGILSPDEIRRMSVTKKSIIYPVTFEGQSPKLQGLLDPRQGPADRHSKCLTCSGSYVECPGHFGHIELNKPVYNVAFLPQILKILRCVCFHCSNLLAIPNDASEEKESLSSKRKKAKICAILNTTDDIDEKTVRGCGRPQPKYSRKGLELTIKWVVLPDENIESTSNLSAERVLEIFKRISNSDCKYLGLNYRQSRPEWMIQTVLPVPPLAVRPSIMAGNVRSQDDLTYNLARIVQINNELAKLEARGASSIAITEHIKLLQQACACLIDNEIAGVPSLRHKTSGRPLKSITARLKGKEGRIRSNLMGKRVDFSARSVITPDPNLALDQVGVPESIAKNLTVPEIVTPYNVDRLQALIGCKRAKYLIFENGERIDLAFHPRPSEIVLRPGYIVERTMMDDDLVVFNRQPTLHKMSMMAHRVKILPWSTFRLNLSVTTPYNADFDGDEMNLHLPQSLEAKAELSQLMMVSRLLITPQSNRPVMGIVQDTLTAVTKMTRRDVFIERHDMMNLLMQLPSWNGQMPIPTILKPKPLWTGKQLFSVLLPKQVNCIRTHSTSKNENKTFNWISPDDNKVLIENGQLLSGILCKNTLGTNAGSLAHIIYMECGHEQAAKFYYHIQLVVNHWLLTEGHSVGIADTIADDRTYANIAQTIENSKDQVRQVIENAYYHRLESSPGNTLRQTFENQINKHLNDARNQMGSSVQESLSPFNQFKAMVVSGAKGSLINISQIIACVGQQNVEGKRIPFGFKNRTLPHFIQNDYSPESKGYVENSYLKGLEPTEFFFHAMGGREGLIDTAIKTADTGYVQRRLIKSMESIMITYDGTVRNQSAEIIQFNYGEDGYAGESVEFQSIISLKLSDQDFEHECKFDTDEPSIELEHEWQQLCQDRIHLRQIYPHNDDSKIILPCNIQRLIWNVKKEFHITEQTQSDILPNEILVRIERLIQSTVKTNQLMQIFLRSSLCTRQIIQIHRLTSQAFNTLCGEIEMRIHQAQISPAEMVGVLAAQSIGEPTTQMTLNTFHYAGISAKNVTLGVPRLKEIIDLTKNPKTPSMTLFLNDTNKCHDLINQLQYCTLRHLVRNSSILYEPDIQETIIEEDQQWINDFYQLPVENSTNVYPWVLRFELNREKIIEKSLSMETIASKLLVEFDTCINVIFSDDNADKLILRIRLTDDVKAKWKLGDIVDTCGDDLLRDFESVVLSKPILLGSDTISKVYFVDSANHPLPTWQKRFVLKDNGTIESQQETFLVTDGTAFQHALNLPDIDYRRSYTNDIIEIFRVLGIEAARKAIEREITHVLSSNGSYVNYHHLSLLCDFMTTKGYLTSINRYGINRAHKSPIMKSTFEQTVQVLVEAATHSQIDPLKGVSENILLGQLARMGTGAFDVLIDANKCKQALEVQTIDDGPFQEIMSEDAMIQYNIRNMFAHTPQQSGLVTPSYLSSASPAYASMSPAYSSTGSIYSPNRSPYISITSPSSYSSSMYSPTSNFLSTTPRYIPTSPCNSSVSSPVSPRYYPSSPAYTTSNPLYSPSRLPSYNPMSPIYSPSRYNPISPGYNPNV